MKALYLKTSGFVYFILLILISNLGFSQAKTDSIQLMLDYYSHQNKDAGIIMLYDNQGVEKKYATGFSNIASEQKADINQLFEIGSASKMFTAIAILQLIEEGKLDLNTPIAKFYQEGNIRKLANYKGKNYFDKVTVAMLLNHTSGFIDYLNVYDDDEKAMKIFGVKGKVYSFDELIDLAVKHGDANFMPGKKFKYCNTGYVILGDIITKVSGMPWRQYIQKHIFDKAQMSNTFFGSLMNKEELSREMTAYFGDSVTYMPPTLASSAGEIVSSLEDLLKFLKAWQSGALFSKAETLKMQQTTAFHILYKQFKALKYGYGVMKIAGFYGHGGQTFGFQTYVTYNPELKKGYVIATNHSDVNVMVLFLTMEKLIK